MEHSQKQQLNSMMQSVRNSLGDFDIAQQPLHKGQYSSVFLITGKPSKDQFIQTNNSKKVLKAFFKNKKHKSCQQKMVKHEKYLLQSVFKNRYIISLEKFFEDSNCFYMVFEYLSNGNLNSIIKQTKKPSIQKIKQISLQIARGLEYLHCKKEVIHGSLCPQNILIGANDEVKICDFGMAISEKNKPTKNHTKIQNYENYLPPSFVPIFSEQVKKADVWALGCILYEMQSGNPLFNFPNLKQKSKTVTPDYLKNLHLQKSISGSLGHLISQILTFNHEQRPSIEEVLKHPFFTGQQIPTNKFQGKVSRNKPVNCKPKLDLKKIYDKENINELNMRKNSRILKPFLEQNIKLKSQNKTESLRPIIFTTQGMRVDPIIVNNKLIQIDRNGFTKSSLEENPFKFSVSISSDGRRIVLTKNSHQKSYLLEQLPQKYWKYYEQCKPIVQQLNKSPKISFQNINQQIKFELMYSGRIITTIKGKTTETFQQQITKNKERSPLEEQVHKLYLSIQNVTVFQ